MYPFRPKSTAPLKAGQYWTFPLKNGGFACGVVVARRSKDGKMDSRLFLAGLLDWRGDHAPSPTELEGRTIREQGYAHIKAITETGGEIRGEVKPSWGLPEVVIPSDAIGTWGYNVVRVLAEKYYGQKRG